MAKKHIDVDLLTEDWIGISAADEPIAFEAWRVWRRESLRIHFVPKAYTVPTTFPPATALAVSEYVGILGQIRKSIGWNDSRAALPKNASPWNV